MPSAVFQGEWLIRGSSGLKPLSGNVCLRPKRPWQGNDRKAPVSNPSRGTCSFGLGHLPPDDFRRVSNPSRGTCAFGQSSARCAEHCDCVSNPSRGTCAFGRTATSKPEGGKAYVSNPSRGTCAFGRDLRASSATSRRMSLKPLSGNVCLRPQVIGGAMQGMWKRSQTPLGERVPSARRAAPSTATVTTRLKPLSGNVCLRPKGADGGWQRPPCLKPLSGNVCLRPKGHGKETRRRRRCLKPLSGNVCLRPTIGLPPSRSK